MIKDADESGCGLCSVQAFAAAPAVKRTGFSSHLLLELGNGGRGDVDVAVPDFYSKESEAVLGICEDFLVRIDLQAFFFQVIQDHVLIFCDLFFRAGENDYVVRISGVQDAFLFEVFVKILQIQVCIE